MSRMAVAIGRGSDLLGSPGWSLRLLGRLLRAGYREATSCWRSAMLSNSSRCKLRLAS